MDGKTSDKLIENDSKKEIPTCRRCGRKLKNEKSREIGMGPSCHYKWLAEHSHKKLFTIPEK